jgi:hypothetical protein
MTRMVKFETNGVFLYYWNKWQMCLEILLGHNMYGVLNANSYNSDALFWSLLLLYKNILKNRSAAN